MIYGQWSTAQSIAGVPMRANMNHTPQTRLQGCNGRSGREKIRNVVQVWQLDAASGQWAQQGPALSGHSDWVRDVAWAPNLGLPRSTIASCGQDGR